MSFRQKPSTWSFVWEQDSFGSVEMQNLFQKEFARHADFPKITLERSKCFPTANSAALVGNYASRCWDKPMCIFRRGHFISFLRDILRPFRVQRSENTRKFGRADRGVLTQWIKGVQGLMGT